MKQSECKFVVNEEKRTITCIYHCDGDAVIDYIDHYCVNCQYLGVLFFSKLPKNLQMPTVYVGIARCSDEDEWNEELGKLIAFRRMKNKYYKEFFRTLNEWIHRIDKCLDVLIDEANMFGIRVEGAMDRLDDEIASKISENAKE